MTDVGLVTAGSDLVVICQIDIKNQFFGHGPKSGGFAEGFAVSWVCGIHGTDFET